MRFFDSDQVRDTVMELEELQQELTMDLMHLSEYSVEERRDHLKRLKTFLEKQKVFFFRISLSDDPDALKIKEKVVEAAKLFGYSEIDGMGKFFEQLDHTIQKLENTLDK
jgi:cytochrome oxidase Cu insertion factor (SCO1/SenC/PrrC family)